MPGFEDSCYLLMHGVPWDVAFSLSRARRIALVATIGTLEGRKYNWNTRRFEAPS